MSDELHFEVVHPGESDPANWSLQELCQRQGFDEHFIVECVEYGIAQVPGRQPLEWTFSGTAVLRMQKAWRLHRDLDIHISNLGLVLELLDQRDALEQQVAFLRDRLSRWEPAR